MHTLKLIVQRATLFGATAALVLAAVLPAGAVFADALNPLTNRSLTLSSSAPGWDFTDGSGNTKYAQPNSGANGQKTGNTFSFNVSTDSSGVANPKAVQAFTFQYCTTSAGPCTSPGNNGQTTGVRNPDSVVNKTSDLNVTTATPTELAPAAFTKYIDPSTGTPIRPVDGTEGIPNRDNSEGNFIVLKKDVGDANWSQSAGWAMTATNEERSDGTIADGTKTGAVNYITLINSTTPLQLKSTGAVKVIFFATDTNYITNPGAGAFFVKINDYSSSTTLDAAHVVDGGVTVANVMNQSIEIQTKVLETMDFSVGTVDPYTLSSVDPDGAGPLLSPLTAATARAAHGQCDPVAQGMLPTDSANVLQLGNTDAENSLSTAATYSTHSYWRLSSNSSAGATIYYSGVTLKNTVNDEIKAIGPIAKAPSRGTPQFGLALDNGTGGVNAVDYTTETDPSVGKGVFENGADNSTNGIDASVATDITAGGYGAAYHSPQLAPITAMPNYGGGTGVVNNEYGTVNTSFAFDPTSNTIPVPFATEPNQVVDCVTGKMRYIANIAATTPAGIYTTKVNYIAAPQY